jgi:hypothetical protein
VQDVKEKLRRDFWSSYAAELAFWPAFQAVNFWKVPVRHQLLAVNVACLLDATFLCWCDARLVPIFELPYHFVSLMYHTV